MKVLYVAKDAEDRSDAVKKIGAGHDFMATEDAWAIRAMLEGWACRGFQAIVVEKPEALNPYRELISIMGIPVGDLKAFTEGRLTQHP